MPKLQKLFNRTKKRMLQIISITQLRIGSAVGLEYAAAYILKVTAYTIVSPYSLLFPWKETVYIAVTRWSRPELNSILYLMTKTTIYYKPIIC